MVLAKYGENTEIDENAAGDTVIRNTATGTEVLLSDFVDIVGGVGSSSNRVGGTSFFDGLDANSVNTEESEVTGETYIEARLSSAKTGQASNTFVNFLDDSPDVDNRNELNSSGQFVPDKSGYYLIRGSPDVRGGAVGDDYEVQLFDATNTTKVTQSRRYTNSGERIQPDAVYMSELTADDAYELQVRNTDSSFDVQTNSRADIVRMVVQP